MLKAGDNASCAVGGRRPLSLRSFEKALAFVLANRLANTTLLPTQLFEIFVEVRGCPGQAS